MQRLSILAVIFLLAACAVNPVTGERNLQFYGADWEREVGAKLYAPMRQSQGGDFNLDPELNTYISDVGQRLARQTRREGELQFEFHVLNESTPNAWALPGGKIVVNRGLLTELDSEAELAAVLAHEIVHADASHGARQQSKGMLTQLGMVAGMVLIGSKVDSESGRQAAMMVPALGAQLITQKYSRDAEREADEYGMQYMAEAGYDPQGAVSLQETFVRLSEGRSSNAVSGLFASHPPSRERLERNRQFAAELGDGGETGRDRYRQKTAYLRRVQPAYEAYDEAGKALADGDETTARRKLEAALRIEPREALFHALAGDLALESDNIRTAHQSFDKAVRLNDAFFYHYLGRGHSALKLGRQVDARRDLDLSLEMLPTTQAHFLLGGLDREAGNIDAARSHYQQASRNDSEVGRQAQREMVLMDIGTRPGDFVAVAAATDASGNVYCRIANRTGVPLTNIRIKIDRALEDGKIQSRTESYLKVLEGGAQDAFALGWQVTPGTDLDRRVRVRVSRAQIAE